MININLKLEYIMSILGFQLSNTLLTSFLVTLLIIILSLFFYKNRNKKNIFIKSIKLFVHKLYNFINSIIEDEEASEKILPIVATFFIFILTTNILALIPGFLGSIFIDNGLSHYSLLKSPNSDLNTTLALAIIAVISIQIFSIKTLGGKKYLKRFFNFKSPIKFILGFFELTSESIKILSFSFRLFGNIFAGEVLLLIIAFLVPYFIPVPFMVLEVFVGFVQAFIFTILTITFIKIGMSEEKG